jgi:hypothetical protein
LTFPTRPVFYRVCDFPPVRLDDYNCKLHFSHALDFRAEPPAILATAREQIFQLLPFYATPILKAIQSIIARFQIPCDGWHDNQLVVFARYVAERIIHSVNNFVVAHYDGKGADRNLPEWVTHPSDLRLPVVARRAVNADTVQVEGERIGHLLPLWFCRSRQFFQNSPARLFFRPY